MIDHPSYPRTLPWRDIPTGVRILRVAALTASCLFLAALLTAAWIETAALRQPTSADAVYRHAHRIKSTVRFLTDQQERIYSVVFPTMFGALVLVALLAGAHNHLEQRTRAEIKRRIMDRIADARW